MAYSTEQLTQDLKTAREGKGLSQRTLSKLAGLPQSHISRIENGGVDLRLSSLVEIARALDLEVTLVPRKNLSAVRSIVQPRLPTMHATGNATKAGKELQRLRNTAAKIAHENPALTDAAQLQRRVNDLNHLQLPSSALEELRKINDSLRRPTSALEELRRINESETASPAATEALRKITESLGHVQQLRNELVHSQSRIRSIGKIRPAYSLDDDDHG